MGKEHCNQAGLENKDIESGKTLGLIPPFIGCNDGGNLKLISLIRSSVSKNTILLRNCH